jgi:hypothetical protein
MDIQEPTRAQWKEELRQEELKAARKAGRMAEQSKYYTRGRVHAIIDTCNFFIGHDRPDIAKDLLKHFMIDRVKVQECKITDFELSKAKRLLEN